MTKTTTNQIEKQLREKCNEDIRVVVKKFIDDVEALKEKYSSSNFFKIEPLKTKTLSHLYLSELKIVLFETINANMGEQMLSFKTKELLKKIDLF